MPRTKVKAGQVLVAQVNGYRLVGVVKFANERFISVDEGNGVTGILRHIPDMNTWVMGKIPVTFKVTK